jgi:hypothetical protein
MSPWPFLLQVTNATVAVNTVLRSLRLPKGSALLINDNTYGACRNAVLEVCEVMGWEVVTVTVPLPVGDPREVGGSSSVCLHWTPDPLPCPAPQVVAVYERALAANPQIRWALIDHISSPTATLMPVADLIAGPAGPVAGSTGTVCLPPLVPPTPSVPPIIPCPVQPAEPGASQSWSTGRMPPGRQGGRSCHLSTLHLTLQARDRLLSLPPGRS